jgi:hypothetical protein
VLHEHLLDCIRVSGTHAVASEQRLNGPSTRV